MGSQEIEDMLKDMIKINSVIATELIQLVENSAKMAHGAVPEGCKNQHLKLKEEIIDIAQRWNDKDKCKVLSDHNLRHEENLK